MTRLLTLIVSLAILMGALALGGIVYFEGRIAAPGPSAQPVIVDLPRGAGVIAIGQALEEAGAIKDANIFRLATRYRDKARDLRFGEYEIPAGASIDQIIDQLVRGEVIQRRVTVAEGRTSWEVAALLNENEELQGGPVEPPAEGAVAPNTYFFQRGETRQQILDRMQEAQRSALAELWEGRAENLPLETPEEALVLASIVEKETGVAEERPQVAAVFINRLRKGMRLQSDPTIIYGITLGKEPLGRGLRRSEIDRKTDWNTYQIDGLPPTPIANPGRDSIAAVLNPPESEFFYFVADGTGGHAFARTLAEHNRNVAEWRRIERERARAQ